MQNLISTSETAGTPGTVPAGVLALVPLWREGAKALGMCRLRAAAADRAFLDSTSMIVLTMPLVYPLVKEMGIEPMWFAMVCILSIEAGLVTPPVGLNVYGVKSVAEPDVSTEDIFIGAVPFLIMTLIALGLVIVFPPIANWLPQNIVR